MDLNASIYYESAMLQRSKRFCPPRVHPPWTELPMACFTTAQAPSRNHLFKMPKSTARTSPLHHSSLPVSYQHGPNLACRPLEMPRLEARHLEILAKFPRTWDRMHTVSEVDRLGIRASLDDRKLDLLEVFALDTHLLLESLLGV